MYRKGVFLVQEAMRTLRRHKGVTALSVVIMSLSLLMLAVFLLATDNLLRFVGEAERDMKVYVYLDDRVSSTGMERLNQEILSQEGVASVVFISKAEAMADFRNQLGEDAELVDVLDTNPLPNAFWVTPKNEFRNEASMSSLAAGISSLRGVEEVRYGKEFLERFSSIVRGVYYVDMIVGFIVILSAIFIISNAVRLTIISRRKNIQILKLVGATNRFITAPFLIEGAFQGGVAAILSLALLFVVTLFSQRVVPDLHFFTVDKALIFMVTCILIGSIGSFTALRRYLRMETR
jgi:cell division transport system permease protein